MPTRPFALLAVASVGLMVAGLMSAALGSPGAFGAFGIGPAVVGVAVHGLAAWGLGRGASGVPGRLGLLAEKNRGRGRPLVALGAVTLALAAGFGRWAPGSDARLGMTALAVGFQPGAFVGECLLLAAQGRLAREASGRAG